MHTASDEMTLAEFDTTARKWARDLEDMERMRSGLPLIKARKALARKIGVPAGTLETLRNGRRKGICAWAFDRLRSAIVNELQSEIARCQHEIHIARQIGVDPRSPEMDALARAVERAQYLMDSEVTL